ncbi:hypothetical protein C0Q70_06463 [Pomacea canaliculata]|uniref:Profilin n=1 Tax=Pomacea canaliculata TaxID=400727 RepID=A0A2T7PP31_POMCA|nr:uncharacterized protein LOC112560758 [Pomacea canaliculata]PVD35182.1 hypothetical protein C0Q70_06463 [Pomacea canaliculata]
MSWNDFKDRLIEQKVELCGIYDRSGKVLASSPDFHCSPDEVATIANAFARKNQFGYEFGVVVGGKRWAVIILDMDSGLLIAKGKDTDNQHKTMVIAVCSQTVIIGENKDESVPGSDVRVAVERLQDDFKLLGY